MVSRFISLSAALVWLGGCLEIGGTEWRIDLANHSASLRLTDLRSTEESGAGTDLKQLIEKYVEGDAITSRFPAANFGKASVRVEGASLVLDVPVTWRTPRDVGLSDWDLAGPYRFCPDHGYMITKSNADFRDGDGCVVWAAGRTVLVVHTDDGLSGGPSLATVFSAWEAQGRPELEAFAESWARQHEATLISPPAP